MSAKSNKSEVSRFKDLASRAKAARVAALAAEKDAVKAALPGIRTKRAIVLAADGTPKYPVGTPVAPSPILISAARWAPWIVAAARAWKRCPGLEVLDERPIPDKGLGIEAGRRIFELAANGASAQVVARAINQARAALGKANTSGTAYSDSEDGILTFVRQLSRYFDGEIWSPPLNVALRAAASSARKDLAARELSSQPAAIGKAVFTSDRAKDIGPRTWDEAADWLVTFQAFIFAIGKQGSGWLPSARATATPAWRGPRTSMYRVGELVHVVESVSRHALKSGPFPHSLLRRLHPPEFEPSWAGGATIRPSAAPSRSSSAPR